MDNRPTLEARPPALIEKAVRLLVPPASREHVLGDLAERYTSPRQYAIEALRAVPFLVASQVRRTTNPLFLSFLAFFLWFGVFGGGRGRWPVAVIPTLAALAGLVLRDVYRSPDARQPRRAVLDIVTAAGCVGLSQLLVSGLQPDLLMTGRGAVAAALGFIVLFFVRQGLQGSAWPPLTACTMTCDEVVRELQQYQHGVRQSNRVEIGVGLVLVPIFAVGSVVARGALNRIGCLLIVAGVLFVILYIRTRSYVRPIPGGAGFAAIVDFYRYELERRQALLRTVVWWYVLPIFIGPMVTLIGTALTRPQSWRNVAVPLVGFFVMGLFVALMNRGAAHWMRQRIEALATMEERQ